ncbi:Ankyrin Repeat [Seminavis robusta]|uniref:Ankyrin Repeat n=1 Tax=Seminavis robusta TaxID=568900 RepID=A0A9N8HAM9_9STRA|nr:Ankyrin Repeat [Seminavis robusta]|eukprot:Sro154_g070070.1 Ankyrin Repeat (759) ;mRNA; r:61082-63452
MEPPLMTRSSTTGTSPVSHHSSTSSSLHSHHVIPSSSASSSPSKKGRRDLPPLFWYMEMGDWEKATVRAKSHPKEVKTRATLRTKSMAEDGTKVAGTKRLALHHACFKLRSAGSSSIPDAEQEDPFLSVCKFILLLLEIYPDACQVRESRHGCLPLHLASFASCYVRPPSLKDDDDDDDGMTKSSRRASSSSTQPSSSSSLLGKPTIITRSASESTASTTHSNMTAILMEENFAAAQTQRKKEGAEPPHSNNNNNMQQPIPNSEEQQQPQQPDSRRTIFISNKREQMAVKVLNAMLDAYPRAIRLDSEGGRLPLHTACAGRATPRCVSLLLRAYPAAARHRNKDGFLPLHLAAHWGVSHPNVAITLLKAYPDATVGRNRWERTPLEEALVMAGENGRPHQAPLVRALRKHPSYWTRPPQELFQQTSSQRNLVGSNVVDIDVTLASNDDDTTLDDNPRYFNMGHSILLEDEYERGPQQDGEEAEYNNQGGLINRLRRGSSRSRIDVDISQDLPTLIKNLNWKSVIARLECNPDEANDELVGVMTRGGFTSSASMTPLHYALERKPPVDVIEALLEANPEAVSQRMMPGGCLPMHIACTWQCSPTVISALLSADPTTAKVVDELGNRPLHAACFSGATFPVIQDLLSTYPKAVLSRNNQGSQPIDICRRLRHPNRRAVMAALLEKRDYLIAKQKHKRSKSSGSMGNVARTAANLNDQFGASLPNMASSSFEEVPRPEEPSVGVEVTYNHDTDKTQTLLWI